MELTTDEAAQSPADYGAGVGGLSQSTGEQIDIVHRAVNALQCSDGSTIHYIAELIEILNGRKSAKFAPFNVARDTVIATVLDNLCSQIQTGTFMILTTFLSISY